MYYRFFFYIFLVLISISSNASSQNDIDFCIEYSQEVGYKLNDKLIRKCNKRTERQLCAADLYLQMKKVNFKQIQIEDAPRRAYALCRYQGIGDCLSEDLAYRYGDSKIPMEDFYLSKINCTEMERKEQSLLK